MLVKIVLLYLAIINLVAFIMYWRDKRKAKKNVWRTPEATLIGVAAIGGSIGALASMYIFRHKTQHAKFKYGVPAILIVQIALAVALYVLL